MAHNEQRAGSDYCYLGVDWNWTASAGSVVAAPTVWRWDEYSVNAANQTFSETLSPDPSGAGSWSGLAFSSGSGWRKVDTFGSRTYTRTHSTQTVTLSVSTNSYFSTVGPSGYVSIGSLTRSWTLTIDPLASYAVTYNANGGSGAPSARKKWYGETLTLSSTRPTRTGYTFLTWNTNSSGTGTNYAPGASYTGNAALTLYAKWTANTYTITFDANGGSGGPGTQTKTHGTDLTLSATVPTRTNYVFKGWATSANATTAQYRTGANNDQNTTFTTNAATTLYAVWELAYVAPRITNLKCFRCDAGGNADDEGTRCYLSFTYAVDTIVDASTNYATVTAKVGSGSSETLVASSDQKTGTNTWSGVLAATGLDVNSTHAVSVTLSDVTGGSSYAVTSTATLSPAFFTIDVLAEGHGMGIGKPATTVGLLDIGMDVAFNGNVTLAVPNDGTHSVTATDLAPWLKALFIWGTYTGITATVTQATSPVKLSLSTFDGNGCSSSSNGIKVPTAGKYLVWSSMYVTEGYTSGDILHLCTYKNSNSIYEGIYKVNATTPYMTLFSGPHLLTCAANDVLYLYTYNQTGARGKVQSSSACGLTVLRIS